VTVRRERMDGKTMRSEVLRGDELMSSSSPDELPRTALPLKLPPEQSIRRRKIIKYYTNYHESSFRGC